MSADGGQEDAGRNTGRFRNAANHGKAESDRNKQHADVAELFNDGAQAGFFASRRWNVRQHGRFGEIAEFRWDDKVERRRGEDFPERFNERKLRERANQQLPAPRGDERLRNEEQESPGQQRQPHLRRMARD